MHALTPLYTRPVATFAADEERTRISAIQPRIAFQHEGTKLSVSRKKAVKFGGVGGGEREDEGGGGGEKLNEKSDKQNLKPAAKKLKILES